MNDEITVIIPTYRRPAMLRRAVRSVLAQTYPYVRVLIMDNASGDETAEVARALRAADTRVQYHCHAENLGAVANFNSGLQRVETPFFAMLSDDDICLPHFYACAMEGFAAHPDAWFSAGVRVQVRDPPGVIEAAPIATWKPGRYAPPDGGLRILRDGLPGVIDSVFRRQVLDEVSGFPERVLGSDLDFMLRIALKHPFVLATSRPCSFFVFYPQPRAGLGPSSLLDELEPAYEGIKQRIANDHAIPEHARQEVCAYLDENLRTRLWTVAVSHANRRNFAAAQEALRRLELRWPDAAATHGVRNLLRLAEHVRPAVPAMRAAAFVRRHLMQWRAIRHLQKVWPAGFREAEQNLHLLAMDR